MRKALAFAAYAYVVFIVVVSLSKFVIGILPRDVPNSDKYAHAIAYMLFVVIWGAFLGSDVDVVSKAHYIKKIVKAFVFGVLFGVLMEIAQWTLTSYRQFDVLDMLANTLGAVFGLLIMRLSLKYFSLIKKSGY